MQIARGRLSTYGRAAPLLRSTCRLRVSPLSTSAQQPPTYTSSIYAEPLSRYKKGGYHPVILGESLKAGRYKVLHKLGWGGYSTVWAAKDQREGTYVAVKISVAEISHNEQTQELQSMKELASHHPFPEHTLQMLDHFNLNGPNGSHQCLVYEMLGPNVPDTIEARFPDDRLPGKLAKAIAKQSLIGLQGLHRRRIGHGDLHTRNLVFTIPGVDHMTEERLIEILGTPNIDHVEHRDGNSFGPEIPEYLVKSAFDWPNPLNQVGTQSIKIIDFGGSFLCTTSHQTIHTPLSVRPPEVIFQDHIIDYRVDLWSMGCMLFELFTGQPPFDTLFLTQKILIGQMEEIASDDLPERWKAKRDAILAGDDDSGVASQSPKHSLQGWLEEVYFDGHAKPDLTKEDIVKLGKIIGKLLYFEPSARASVRQILADPWFDE